MMLGDLGNPAKIVGVPSGVVVALMDLSAAHQKTICEQWKGIEATGNGRAIDGGSGRGRRGGQEVVMAGAGASTAGAEVKAEV